MAKFLFCFCRNHEVGASVAIGCELQTYRSRDKTSDKGEGGGCDEFIEIGVELKEISKNI